MFGHANQEAISHLARNIDGLEITRGESAPGWKNCEVCVEIKLDKMISRRQARETAERLSYRIGLDLLQ
jgi:hypothetical protein